MVVLGSIGTGGLGHGSAVLGCGEDGGQVETSTLLLQVLESTKSVSVISNSIHVLETNIACRQSSEV